MFAVILYHSIALAQQCTIVSLIDRPVFRRYTLNFLLPSFFGAFRNPKVCLFVKNYCFCIPALKTLIGTGSHEYKLPEHPQQGRIFLILL